MNRRLAYKSYRSSFDRSKLPTPRYYYNQELQPLKLRGEWAEAHCPFHKNGKENVPSLSVNLFKGHFKCFSCGIKGGDILAFQMLRYGQDFKTAAKKLGAWRSHP